MRLVAVAEAPWEMRQSPPGLREILVPRSAVNRRDGDAWAAFDVGGATLALERRSAGAHQPAGVMASLKVGRDLDQFVEALRESGATVTAPKTGAHERVATLTDPDGNQTSLYVAGTAS